MKEKLSRDNWLGLTGMGGGIVLYLLARLIEDWEFDVLGASFVPKLSSVLMFIFGLLLFVTSLPERKTLTPVRKNPAARRQLLANLKFIAVLIIYVTVLPLAGFIPASIALLLVMYFYTVRRFDLPEILKGVSFSVVSILAVWLIFTKQFDLILP